MPWSWVNTEYSIHRVQYTLSTASTHDCPSSRHSHNSELTPECSFSFRGASLQDRPPPASSPWEVKDKVTTSHAHGCEWTNGWIEPQHPVHLQSTAPKHSSNLARSWPPSASRNGLDHGLHVHLWVQSDPGLEVHLWVQLDLGLQMHLHTPSITASKWISEFNSIVASKFISKLARSQPASSHDHRLPVHPSRFRPPSASLSSLNHGFQVHLETWPIKASKCIAAVARIRPPSASLSSLDHGLPPSASRYSLDQGLQVHL